MRPSSAKKPSKPVTDMRVKTSSRYKRDPELSNQLKKTNQTLKSEAWNWEKPSTVKLKTLGMIHAYRPDLLKECMASEKSSIKKYAKGGECNLNDVFVKTALVLFRDWREKMHTRLTLLIDAVTTSEEVMEHSLEEKVKAAVGELRVYISKIKLQIEELCLKGEEFKLVRLREKYTLLLQTTEHVLKLVDCMRSLSNEVENYLHTKKDSGFKDAQMEAGVRAIAQKHEIQAAESLNYCACHPDNQVLLRLEFKARSMLISSTQKVAAIFDSIRSMQQYEANFKKQMLLLESFQDFSPEYLGHVLQILYSKNEEIKSIEKKFQVSKMPQFIALRGRIQDWETNFIKRLKPKSLFYLKQTLKSLNNTRVLHLIKSKGKQYIQLKKRLILLVKVYQQSEKQSNITAEYYEFEKKSVNDVITTLNETVNALSPNVQQISALIENLQGIKNKGTLNALKWIEKVSEVIDTIQKTQGTIWGITNSAYLKISRIQGSSPEIIDEMPYTDKNCLEKFHKLIIFSRNEEQCNDIFKQLRNSVSKLEEMDGILLFYDKLYNLHQQFIKNALQAGLQQYRQLRDILKEELITYLFGDEFRGEFIAGYPSVRQVCLMWEKLNEVARQDHINCVSYYRFTPSLVEELRRAVNEQIKKLQNSRHKALFNRYIILIYECSLLQLINARQIYRLFSEQQSNLQPYRAIFHQYVQVYEDSLSKSRKEQTYFGVFTAKIYNICAQLNEQNRLICEYKNSNTTNQYFPCSVFLSEWLMYEFSAQIEQTISKSASSAKRAQIKIIFTQFIKKMEAQKEKLKASNMKAQTKDIYQHITTNISMLKQFDFAEEYQQLLLKLMKYLQVLQIPHSVIFTRDQKPVCILIAASDRGVISDMVLNLLSIGHASKGQSFLTPFQFKHASPVQLIETNQPKSPILQINSKVNEEAMAQEIQDIEIADQVIKSIVEQQLIQDIQSNLPVSSVLKPATIQNELSKPINLPLQNIQTVPKLFNYYKLQQISDIIQLRSCLYYHNNEYFSIQSKINLQLLCQALRPKNKQKAIAHIRCILQEMRKNDIIRLMNLSDTIPDCEHHLIRFQNAIQKDESNLKSQFDSLLDYFKVQKSVIYAEGANYVQSFRKQHEQSCIVYANLVQNCFKGDLRQFQIEKIVESVWKAINVGPNNFFNAQAEISKCIDNTNTLLISYYQQVKKKISQFGQSCANRKEVEEQVNIFMERAFHKNKVIQNMKLSIKMYKDLIGSLSCLDRDLRAISVVQPYFTLKIDNTILFIDSTQITQKTICNCLFLPQFYQDFDKCIASADSSSTQTAIIRQYFLNKIRNNRLQFKLIQDFLDSQDKPILQIEVEQRNKDLSNIQQLKSYVKMFDPELGERLSEIQNTINLNKQILTYLLQSNISKIRKTQQFCLSQDIRMTENGGRSNTLKFYDSYFLQKIASLLDKNKVIYHKVQYRSKTIALIERFNLKDIAEKLAISRSDISKLQLCVSSNESIHTINKMYLRLSNLVPTFDNYDKDVQQKIKKYLGESTFQAKQKTTVFTKNGGQFISKGNFVELEVEWPKEAITVNYHSSRSSCQITILPTNYCYYAEIQLLTLRTHISAHYQQIKTEYIATIKQAQQEAQKEEIKKQEHLKQLQKIAQQRELEILKIQQEKARVKFNIQEFNRKNKELQAAEKANLKFIQEKTLNKLKLDNEKLEKFQSLIRNDKINQRTDCKAQEDPNADYLQFQICLSQGEGQHYAQDRHCKQYDIEYDYRKTLYHHIKQTYHSLRKKQQIDIKNWIHPPL